MENSYQFLEDQLKGDLPDFDEIIESYRQMIISVSGWRKVFSISGDEEDADGRISRADAYLCALIAYVYGSSVDNETIIVARDGRNTGSMISGCAVRILLALGKKVAFLSIASAPEIMAYSSQLEGASFFYISASHNPIGHNGFKFGRDGGVYSSQTSADLIRRFSLFMKDPAILSKLQRLSKEVTSSQIDQVLNDKDAHKRAALDAYYQLLIKTNRIDEKQKEALKVSKIGIIGELNGSARAVSIDRELFESLSLPYKSFNTRPGICVHPIVPEGENLDLCRNLLREEHLKEGSFVLGYVPDNDGDRGNIVYWDELQKKVVPLQAQELFALISLIELTRASQENEKLAIAVNGPTSLLVDNLCSRLGARVERCEVGEANVVLRGEQLRKEGWCVPLVGEGSNGGIISYPCKVRDPMNTLLSIVNLLSDENLFRKVTRLHQSKPSLSIAVKALEKRTITGSFSSKAKLKIKSNDYKRLKENYIALFTSSFEKRRREMESEFGIHDWKLELTVKTECFRYRYDQEFEVEAKGGLKVLLYDSQQRVSDFLWMRASGTEPVFRIAVDAEGDDQKRHDDLLTWHRNLILSADKKSH